MCFFTMSTILTTTFLLLLLFIYFIDHDDDSELGVTTTVTTNPLWMVKTRMQLQVSQMSNLYKNSLDCLYKVIKQEGILSLYRGLTASLVGISESTIHWLIYENLKKRYHLHSDRTSKSWHDWWMYLSCAAVSKFTASAITYPHEVIRTRLREPPTILQYKYHGVYHAAVTILREEGVRALYGGMSAHLLRVVPNTAIMFLCYEGVVHFAKNKFQT
ncbi:hypothetical protein HMI55_005043 [Coelomomyces lativittatus]|nr:hypothetical protein HMI55_005043 [Coelomomyces lativittatus]